MSGAEPALGESAVFELVLIRGPFAFCLFPVSHPLVAPFKIMLKATPEEVRAFLCKRLQVILDSAKEPDCGLPLQTVELVEAWSTQSIKVFGLDEGGSLNPLLTSMSAVEDINRLLVRFFKQIQNHEVHSYAFLPFLEGVSRAD